MPSKPIIWTTEQIKLGDLIEWEHNPVKLSDHDAEQIQISIEKFGLVLPLVANQPKTKRSTKCRLIDGHQRKTIMVLSEIANLDTNLDVRVPSRKLTSRECDELSVRLRKNTGEFDFSILVDDFKVDDLLDWGFEEQELDLDLWNTENAEDDPGAQIDKAEELREKWGVETGQLWQLGEHRLICGDCTDGAIVDQLMQGEKAGAVVTDPPYGIEREGIPNDDPEGLRKLYDGCLVAMPITDAVVIAFQSPRLEWIWLDAARDAGHKPERLLWVYKPNDATTFPWRGWLMVSDVLRITSIGNPEWRTPKEFVHDCYTIQLGELHDVDGLHTTPKDPEVVMSLVDNTTGNVLDPFLGSGTTLIACERLGRKCRAVEISPAYCAVAIQRWVDITSDEPELIK